MVSLYLVEDEVISRESIKRNIAWEEHGIQFLGDAPDGDMALPQILEKKPDILLTDVKMPFMDGLELSKLVKKTLPDTKIIILSGYNEFDYARQAISIGINEYLLKPVSSADIIGSVNKVKQEIETLRQKKKEQEQWQTLQQDALRQLFFNGLFSGYLSSTSQIIQRAEQLNISLCSKLYQVLNLHIAAHDRLLDAEEHRIFLMPPANILTFARSNEEISYLLQAADDEHLERLCGEIKGWIKSGAASRNLDVKYKQGSVVGRIADICKSYKCANMPSFNLGKGESANLSASVAFKGEDLLEFLRTGKTSMIESFWAQYSPAILQALSSTVYRCYLYTEIFFVITRFTEETGINLPVSLASFDDMENVVSENDSIDGFNHFIYDLCSQVMNSRDELNTGHLIPIALQAKKYIDKHYANPDLSLSMVADAVCVSHNYLSTMFKEKTGSNFSDYLTEVRIRQAKKLLATTDLSISEIANMVGYPNINYFSMIFKKITGMSPSKYQDGKIQP